MVLLLLQWVMHLLLLLLMIFLLIYIFVLNLLVFKLICQILEDKVLLVSISISEIAFLLRYGVPRWRPSGTLLHVSPCSLSSTRLFRLWFNTVIGIIIVILYDFFLIQKHTDNVHRHKISPFIATTTLLLIIHINIFHIATSMIPILLLEIAAVLSRLFYIIALKFLMWVLRWHIRIWSLTIDVLVTESLQIYRICF